MEDIKTIIGSLAPGTGQQLFFDIALYWMFALNIGTMFLGGSAGATNISMAVLLCVFIDKTFAFGYMFNPNNGFYDDDPKTCHAKVFFGTYLIRVVMFAGPFALAGSTKSGKVRAVAIITGLIGVFYMASRWFFEQREFSSSKVTCLRTDIVIQNVGMILVLAKIALRDRLCLGMIHRHIPVTIPRHFTAHDVEV